MEKITLSENAATKVYLKFGISEERKDELERIVNIAMEHTGKPTSELMQITTQRAANQNEFAFMCYLWGQKLAELSAVSNYMRDPNSIIMLGIKANAKCICDECQQERKLQGMPEFNPADKIRELVGKIFNQKQSDQEKNNDGMPPIVPTPGEA